MCELGFSLQDKQTFERLFNDYFPMLVEYAFVYTMREDVAKDLVQDVFVNLWHGKRHFASRKLFRAFLYTAVKNAALDYLRHRSVEAHYLQEMMYGSGVSDDCRVKEEIYRRLFKLIDVLPKRCREIFLLHMDGLGNEEIARKLSISVETVKTHKKRAMKYLRDNLKREE